MPSFHSVFHSAAEYDLQALLGEEPLQLLQAVDEGLLRPSRLREVVMDLRSPASLLLNSESRTVLMDLLRRKEAERLAGLLDLDTSEPFDALRSVSIRKGSTKERRLLHFFNVDVPERDTKDLEPASKRYGPDYALFPHQRTAARKVQDHLRSPSGRVLLHMPTGAGKTRTAMNVIAEHLRATEPGLVVWLAYSEELCEQAASEFESAWSFLGNREISVHRFWGDRDLDVESVRDGFMVAGLSKMHALGKRDFRKLGQVGARTTLVIIDEAHQAIAKTYKHVLDALTVHRRKPGLLGLTATPGRTWADINEDRRLAAFFDRNKVMLEVEGYDNPVSYLQQEGYLATPRFKNLLVEPGLTLTSEDRAGLKDRLELSDDLLQQLAEDEERNSLILTRLEEMLERHERILFFGTTVAHAEVMATVLQARGHRAAVITGQTGATERKRRIRAFKQSGGEPMVLCNYGVLTTGFDAPNTSAAMIARPTQSLVLYSQMVGRAIRGTKADGNETAEIVSVVDESLPGFDSVANAFTNWEDVWE